MARKEWEGDRVGPRRTRVLGVRARLLLAFFAIAAFAILAAAAGIYAFNLVGTRLTVVENRLPPTLSAIDLARSAERIIATAPALLAATERPRRDEVKAQLAAEVERVNARLRDVEHAEAQTRPLGEIGPLVSRLTATLGDLDELVDHRLDSAERIAALRQAMFDTNADARRLLAPWLEVREREIAASIENTGETDRDAAARERARLAALIRSQRSTQAAQQQFTSAVDMLAEASTSEEARRLTVLDFQLGLAFRALEKSAAELAPKLRPLFLERVSALHAFARGPESIVDARRLDLALVEQGQDLLAEATDLSAQLTAAVDRLGNLAKDDIGQAIGNALSVQELGTNVLIVLVALSLLTSILIVWLYVGRNIVRRLSALSESTLAIANGTLDRPVAIEGRDEIAAMSRAVEVFRHNAIDLERLLDERQRTMERLEQLVEERTRDLSDTLKELEERRRDLENANRYKSHFLAAASHDLRQPLHALNLFIAQLRNKDAGTSRSALVDRIEAAARSMNELFDSLLDMSKLEAGVLEPHLSDFPVDQVLSRIETTFLDAARRKGLRFGVVSSSAWVRSDPVLLERILINLVSNAVRYTSHGGIVVGCRRRGDDLRIDICDTGPGIAEAERRKIFGEYYRFTTGGDDDGTGLGLGLTIVERLGRLLDHDIELDSRPQRGSRFSVLVPTADARRARAATPAAPSFVDPASGKLVAVIDDDPLVLDGMRGLLTDWGCQVAVGESADLALADLAHRARRPDLVISDYRLADGTTGIEAIARIRDAFGATIPALLISGDTASERLRHARQHGLHLLHKPVPPMQLRTIVNRLLRAPAGRETTATGTEASASGLPPRS